MSRFHDSDLDPFRHAIANGSIVNAICGAITYRVTSIDKQTAYTAAWNIPLGKIQRFEVTVASFGF
jgi:uncharacterized membrane protein YsdA (DUF1294 family)